MSLLIDLQCFPCVDYFKKVINRTNVIIEQYETYQKLSFRNRYIVAGANGLCPLSIPLVGGREQKKLIKDILIDHSSNWGVKHWRTINSSYRKAPYFDYYAGELEGLLVSEEKYLFDFNLKVFLWLIKLLKLNVHVELTKDFEKNPGGIEDYRSRILPKGFQDYAKDWRPKYFQLFQDKIGFQSNLSILDLLLCEGPNSINLIQQSV